jgi:hypothetical protein
MMAVNGVDGNPLVEPTVIDVAAAVMPPRIVVSTAVDEK